MIRNHRQLSSLMAGADPAFLAGRFATDFQTSSRPEGERGTFLYFKGGYWDIRIDGGPAFQLTPYGSKIIQANGSVEAGPPMLNPPRRPPWSLVLPRHSTFLGGADDDWQPDIDWPVTRGDGSWLVPVTNLEMPMYKGTLAVDATTGAITRAHLGQMVQTLVIDRTEPTDDDLAALESLKSNVNHCPGDTEGEG